MPPEKPPVKLGLFNPDFQSEAIPYKVRDLDDWKSLARRSKVTPNQLMDQNFGTIDPLEINWYLNHKVGCKLKTPDGRNWRFSSRAHPGIIYLPFQRYPRDKALLPSNFAPKGGQRYRVQTGDSFVSLARKYSMPDPKGLVQFNFQTTDPYEVNWNLQFRVGCTKPTIDGTSWIFTSDATPGIIYFPDWVKGLPYFNPLDI